MTRNPCVAYNVAVDVDTNERDLSSYVAIDFASDDTPERCSWCPDWRFEWVDLPADLTVLREWHLPSCDVAIEWAEITE